LFGEKKTWLKSKKENRPRERLRDLQQTTFKNYCRFSLSFSGLLIKPKGLYKYYIETRLISKAERSAKKCKDCNNGGWCSL